MNNKILEVEYVSLWDGSVEIVTNAKYNQETGIVYDIETTDEGIDDLDTLEREFIRLEDDSELDVCEDTGEIKVIDFVHILKVNQSSEEPFIDNLDYLNIDKVLVEFANFYGVVLNHWEINEIDSTNLDVDADGYPYTTKTININKYNCKLTISAYHHNNWDYYIEEIESI